MEALDSMCLAGRLSLGTVAHTNQLLLCIYANKRYCCIFCQTNLVAVLIWYSGKHLGLGLDNTVVHTVQGQECVRQYTFGIPTSILHHIYTQSFTVYVLLPCYTASEWACWWHCIECSCFILFLLACTLLSHSFVDIADTSKYMP